jgi:hypothetical protein
VFIPYGYRQYRQHFQQLRDVFTNEGVQIHELIPENLMISGNGTSVMDCLEEANSKVDLIIAVIFNQIELVRKMVQSPSIAEKLILFADKKTIKRNKDIRKENLYQEKRIRGFDPQRKQFPNINRFPELIQREKAKVYLRSSKNIPIKYGRTNGHYFVYREEIDIFLSPGCRFLIYLLGLMKSARISTLEMMLVFSHEEMTRTLGFLERIGFVYIREDEIFLRGRAYRFFELFGFEEFKSRRLMEEKRLFMERWTRALQKTIDIRIRLENEIAEFNHLSRTFYFARARELRLKKGVRKRILGPLGGVMTEAEKKIWSHPFTKQLYENWLEYVAGVKRDLLTETRERTAFFDYLFDRFRIRFDPVQSLRYQNIENLLFSLTMLRKNNQAHFYINYSFGQRPLKKMIREYFDLALITGKYQFFMHRQPRYHNMLMMYKAHGERTYFDSRDFDFTPLTYNLDTKFSVPVKIENVRSRQFDRYISCPVIIDVEGERERRAQIKDKEAYLNRLRPKPDIFSNVEYNRADGRIYYKGDKTKTLLSDYGKNRANWIQGQSELKLMKSIRRYHENSGMIVRFNLLDPVAVLLNGLNIQRDIRLDDILLVLKCLEVAEYESRANQSNGRSLNEIIEYVFITPEPVELSEETKYDLRKIESIRQEDPTENSAWKYLTAKMIEGRFKALLQTICTYKMNDGFELLFSLWPLLMGTELHLDETGTVAETDGKAGNKRYLLQMTERLSLELSDLLRNVFARHVVISAATKRIQSETKLARTIVRHCLNPKESARVFRRRLKKHLETHYRVYSTFMEEYLAHEKSDSHTLKEVLSLSDIPASVQADTDGILALVEETRMRLLRPGANNRLLLFIDTDNLEVLTGHFVYSGKALKAEEAFIAKRIQTRQELARLINEGNRDIERSEINRKRSMEIARSTREKEISQMENKAQVDLKNAALRETVNKQLLMTRLSELDIVMVEQLKSGELKELAFFLLYRICRENQGKDLSDILAANPDLFRAIDPNLFVTTENIALRQKIVDVMERLKSEIDPFVLLHMTTQNPGDAFDMSVLAKTNRQLVEAVKFQNSPFHILHKENGRKNGSAVDPDESA